MRLDPSLGRTAAIHTMGCRLNFAESGRMQEQLVEAGFSLVKFGAPAALNIINSCVVTQQAEREVGQLIRQAKKAAPTCLVAVMGCAAQVQRGVAGADLVLGNEDKFALPNLLKALPTAPQATLAQRPTNFWPGATGPRDGHTRSFLKIQDGCDYVCSYCLIPQARGPARSPEISLILNEAQHLVELGYQEIVLTGVNIGEFKSPAGENLTALLQALLKVEGLPRLRISSVEPNTISEELLEVLASSPKAMGHFHLPLQSGDDEILAKMRRHYDTKLFAQKVKLIKQYFPQGAIGTDVIVGFPGESAQHFKNTYDFLQELEISHFHIFPFSRRPKTIAYTLPAQVAPAVKKQRAAQLRKLGAAKYQQLTQQMLGQTAHVLLEEAVTFNGQAGFLGYTENFCRTFIPQTATAPLATNQIVAVKITSCTNKYLQATLNPV
ncbi:MAG: tRNA (N(6)-L-threonylcarbamoyladenosine(37)-C(2))-methylthiotransferase MtaB [Bacteriovoracaceae bacterium]|nr:tRNA (N(6)-L-threonylcarbamoyladenosine(37)-C(2))-methylthiotransferase MtaB [Bacteriovoracaceae bacterium]